MSEVYGDPTCEQCGGVGVIVSETSNSSTFCECQERTTILRIVGRSGIPKRYQKVTVKGYNPATPIETKTKDFIAKWIKDYVIGDMGIVLNGPVGTGKTHLLTAIGMALAKKQIQAFYWNVCDLLDEARDEFKNPEFIETSVIDKACKATVLLLDDLGAEQATEWSVSMISKIIDERYSKEKTTLITTNLTMADIKKRYDQRVSSRLEAFNHVLKLDGHDRRLAMTERVA